MAMKRGHTAWIQIKDSPIACYRTGISVSTRLYCGFPGETDEDFAATIKLIEDIGFDTSFQLYTVLDQALTAEIPDNVDANTKKNRLQILRQRIHSRPAKLAEKWSAELSDYWWLGLQRTLVNFRDVQRITAWWFCASDDTALIGQFVLVNSRHYLNSSR